MPAFIRHIKRVRNVLSYGFTLIEVMIVITLIGILTATTATSIHYSNLKHQAHDMERKADLNLLHKVIVQYYTENRCYPTHELWNMISCTGPVPDFLKPYLSEFPCDPETNEPYYYETTNHECQYCHGGCGVCMGFRLMTNLKNTKDPAITAVGCNPDTGCGVVDHLGHTYNYGVSIGCHVSPPGYGKPTPTPTIPTTPTHSPTPSVNPIESPTITPTPGSYACAGVTPPVYPTNPKQFSLNRYSDAILGELPQWQNAHMALQVIDALEWYKHDNGEYPNCGCGTFVPLDSCLYDKLSVYINDPTNASWKFFYEKQLMVSGPEAYFQPTTTPLRYEYAARNNNGSGMFSGYCLATTLGDVPDGLPNGTSCPFGHPSNAFTYIYRERESLYRNTISYTLPSSPAQADAWDTQRIIDINTIARAFEAYRKGVGHIPQEPSNAWYGFAPTIEFNKLVPTYLPTVDISDPSGIQKKYSIRQFDKDTNGYFTRYCLGAHLDNQDRCFNECPFPFYWTTAASVCTGITGPNPKITPPPTPPITIRPTPTPVVYPTPIPGGCKSYAVSEIWGTKDPSGSYYIPGSEVPQFNYPIGIKMDNVGNVVVSDTENHRIKKYKTFNNFSFLFGVKGSNAGEFMQPAGIGLDIYGNIYVVDHDLGGLNRIQKFSSLGAYIMQWGTHGTGIGQFGRPYNIAIDNPRDAVYVSDVGGQKILRFTRNGTFVREWGSVGNGDTQFLNPWGVAVKNNGNVLVADSGHHVIKEFTPDGIFVSKWGSQGSSAGQFFWPGDIEIDSLGNIYVLDRENHRIQKFDANRTFITQFGSHGSGNGQFKSPSDMTVYQTGDILYVADPNNHRIQKFVCAH